MELLNKVYKQLEDAKNPKFKIGDFVRIDKEKGIFGKFYLKNFTEELFRIAAVKHTNPPHYKLEDLNGEEIKGVFYEPELSKTTLDSNQRIAEILKEKKTKKTISYYVHWIGESDENNEWIQKTDNILLV
jgi:NMD protein affecting ribosome stability and mRNA decay